MSSGRNLLGSSTYLPDDGSYLPGVANLPGSGANLLGSGIYPLGGPVNLLGGAANPLEHAVLVEGSHLWLCVFTHHVTNSNTYTTRSTTKTFLPKP